MYTYKNIRTEGLLGALELLALLTVQQDEREGAVEVEADALHQLLRVLSLCERLYWEGWF